MKRFGEKVAVIIGGTSGIGRATAIAFAHEGAKVGLASGTESSPFANDFLIIRN